MPKLPDTDPTLPAISPKAVEAVADRLLTIRERSRMRINTIIGAFALTHPKIAEVMREQGILY